MTEPTIATPTPTADRPAASAPERVFTRTPALEIYEDEQALWVAAELPGVAPADVEVTLDEAVLSVRGRARRGHNGDAVVTEYRRRLTLADPGRYDGEQIHASLRHGVLEVRIPKHARAQRRQIPVSVH